MIDLETNSADVFNESSDLGEIYRVFTGYYGRTLKVSSSSARTEYGDWTEAVQKRHPREIFRSIEEMVTTLTEIQFIARGNSGTGEHRIPGSIRLGLQNREPLELFSRYRRIEVLQEDIGQWKLLFQGSLWVDHSTVKTYGGRAS